MAHFQKRHYEALALLVQQYNERCGSDSAPMLTEMLADMLQSDNHLFKRDRFERACQLGANVRART